MNINNNNSKGVSYTSGFFLLIGFSLVATFIAAFIGLAMLGSVEAMEDPSKAGLLRAIQVGSVLLGMFLPAVAVAAILNRKPFQLLGYQRSISIKQIGLVILIIFASLVVAVALGHLNRQIPVPQDWRANFEDLETKYNKQVAMMLNFKNFGGYILSMIIMAFVPALCEESLFRGGLQNFLTRASRSPWLAIVVVSILFSLAHFSFYLFLPRMFLGVALGLIYFLTGNIWLSIIAHFLVNAMSVTQMYLLTLQGKSMETAMNSDLHISYWGFLAVPVFIYLLIVLKKTGSRQVAVINQTDQHGV